jgi:hypothetical protein
MDDEAEECRTWDRRAAMRNLPRPRPPLTAAQKQFVQRHKYTIIPGATDDLDTGTGTDVKLALLSLEQHICRELEGGDRCTWGNLSSLICDKNEVLEFLGPAAFSPRKGACMIVHLQRQHFAPPRAPLEPSLRLPWAVFRASVEESGERAKHVKAKDHLKALMEFFSMIDEDDNIYCPLPGWCQ